MKKTVNINLNGQVFYIDDDAYARLKDYLDRLERYFRNQDEEKEIINDIESRIAELFREKLKDSRGVITLSMVEDVIRVMGQPEDFNGGSSADEPEYVEYEEYKGKRKRLFRDVDNKVIAGVCSGIAAYLNTDPVFIRVAFVILPFLSVGAIFPVYIILWAVVPAAITTAQKLEMRGENVTIKNIEKTIKNEYEDVKKHFKKMRNSETYRKGESWWKRMTKRDKNIILVVAVICGATLLFHLIPFSYAPHTLFSFTGYPMPMSFGFITFPGFFVLGLVLLIIGLVFRVLFKIMLFVIGLLFVIAIGVHIIGALAGGLMMFC